MLINIHSHFPATGTGTVIRSLYQGFEEQHPPGWYSAGLHPWYIHENEWETEMNKLSIFSKENNVLAIGECGLDKICDTPFALQQQVFAAQVQLANNVSKPLIIHCVRAFDELLKSLEANHNKVPVIFHGYRKNKVLAERLLQKGYYISFGKAILQPAMQELLQYIPLTQLFLETDDADVSIDSIYEAAAHALQIDLFSLSLQIQKNAAAVFAAEIFTV